MYNFRVNNLSYSDSISLFDSKSLQLFNLKFLLAQNFDEITSIINFDLDSNISRQSIVESDITSSERRSTSIQIVNQTSFFIQIEKVRRNMSSTQSSFEIDQVFWNDIMIVIIVFASMFRFVDETSFSVDNNFLQSVIKFVENVNYFDSDYENSFDTNQLIVNSKRHNFYRDVFTFTDHLKNLKKTFSDSKMKKLIFTCLKKDALTWYNTKFIEIEKDFFKKVNIERWCVHLVKRFKKRTSVALKKLQIEIYIYVDARRDRKSRSYMQNILRHAKAADFSSIFHQCTIVWSNFELNFRAQIFESSKNIILSTFLSQLNAKENVWMNMTVRHREQNNNFDQDFSNNVDRSNRSSKQNRARDVDFNQQFYVNSFSQAYMWSSLNYNFYQYRNSTYQAQSNYQFRQSTESYQQKSFDSSSTVLSIAKQSFLLKFSSEFASVSNRKSNKLNVKKFDKFDKIKVYNVDENNETEKVEKDYFDEKNVDDYHVSKNISYYQSIFYNDFEDENDNVVYLITSKVLLSKLNKIVICRKCNNDFLFNNKLHEHFRFDCFDKVSLIYSANVANQSFFIIMITQNSKSIVITRSSIKKLSSINFDAITSSSSATSNKFASSSITSFEFIIILSNTSKSFSINTSTSLKELKSTLSIRISISLKELKFTSISIIVSDVDFSKNVDTDHNFRDWSYARIHVVLSSTADVEFVCLNIDAEIVLCDR